MFQQLLPQEAQEKKEEPKNTFRCTGSPSFDFGYDFKTNDPTGLMSFGRQNCRRSQANLRRMGKLISVSASLVRREEFHQNSARGAEDHFRV